MAAGKSWLAFRHKVEEFGRSAAGRDGSADGNRTEFRHTSVAGCEPSQLSANFHGLHARPFNPQGPERSLPSCFSDRSAGTAWMQRVRGL